MASEVDNAILSESALSFPGEQKVELDYLLNEPREYPEV